MTTACPLCGSNEIATEWIDHRFDYGSEDSTVELCAFVPKFECSDCDIEFLDEIAERRTHEAVCKHLGVLSPAEIRRIREGYGLTRAQFCQLTGFGEASLNRWENGIDIQNHANDRYLRLLKQPDILHRLQGLMESPPPA